MQHAANGSPAGHQATEIPTQSRATATVDAISDATAHILVREGFTEASRTTPAHLLLILIFQPRGAPASTST